MNQVSWVRKGDGHLLSVGDDIFIGDSRFQAQRIPASDLWTLQIRSAQVNDTGDYECQVSSNEPKISRVIHLRIVGEFNFSDLKRFEGTLVYSPDNSFAPLNYYAEPLVSIKGAPDMYVKNGSPVTLHCHVSSFLQSPAHVDWLLNGTVLFHVKNHPHNTKPTTKGVAGKFLLLDDSIFSARRTRPRGSRPEKGSGRSFFCGNGFRSSGRISKADRQGGEHKMACPIKQRALETITSDRAGKISITLGSNVMMSVDHCALLLGLNVMATGRFSAMVRLHISFFSLFLLLPTSI